MKLKDNYETSINTLGGWNKKTTEQYLNILIEQGKDATKENLEELQEATKMRVKELEIQSKRALEDKERKVSEIMNMWFHYNLKDIPHDELGMLCKALKKDMGYSSTTIDLWAAYFFGFIEGIRKERRKKKGNSNNG